MLAQGTVTDTLQTSLSPTIQLCLMDVIIPLYRWINRGSAKLIYLRSQDCQGKSTLKHILFPPYPKIFIIREYSVSVSD